MTEGFLAPRPISATRIGVVVGLHAAVLGALILAPPGYQPVKLFEPLKLIQVPDDPPPPPPRRNRTSRP